MDTAGNIGPNLLKLIEKLRRVQRSWVGGQKTDVVIVEVPYIQTGVDYEVRCIHELKKP